MDFSKEDLLRNISFKVSRSGGKGGQHVNKVSSRVELNYDFEESALLTEEQKMLIRAKLSNRMTSSGLIQVIADEERSQFLNKENAIEKLGHILKRAIQIQKPRKATKPKKSSVEKRLNDKQQLAFKKLNRRKGSFD